MGSGQKAWKAFNGSCESQPGCYGGSERGVGQIGLFTLDNGMLINPQSSTCMSSPRVVQDTPSPESSLVGRTGIQNWPNWFILRDAVLCCPLSPTQSPSTITLAIQLRVVLCSRRRPPLVLCTSFRSMNSTLTNAQRTRLHAADLYTHHWIIMCKPRRTNSWCILGILDWQCAIESAVHRAPLLVDPYLPSVSNT